MIVGVEGVIDNYYASQTPSGVQQECFPNSHPSSYVPRPTVIDFDEQVGSAVSPWSKPSSIQLEFT